MASTVIKAWDNQFLQAESTGGDVSAGDPAILKTSASATEVHIGEVHGNSAVLESTLSLDTSAYADGDVMADTQAIAGAARVNGGQIFINSIQVIDEDDQKQTFDIYFLDANNSLGTENSAPNISDANARKIFGPVRVSSSDYSDLGGVSVARIATPGLQVQAASGGTSLYVATVIRGSATYSASGVKLRLSVMRD